ncbi:outer membrane protein [uncultured Thalassolituus sp.]|uniref:outer membrane protein n=1 Tax=uncultured Thalassolituus sp. TaxID=285273 RepID=UPI002616997C|nr:outer membrane beta-barrel protein [uncultured Thalassolituus sp.]
MNRTALLSFVVLVVPFTVSALEIKERPVVYLGAELGTGSGEETYLIGDQDFSSDVDHDLTRFTLGFRSHQDNRFEISYVQNDLSSDDWSDEQITSLNLDAVITVTEFRVRPFVRLGFGFTNYVGSHEDIAGKNEDLRGFALSGGAGLLIEVVPQLELDVGYHYTSIGWEDLNYTDSNGNTFDYDLGNDFSYASAGFRILFQ